MAARCGSNRRVVPEPLRHPEDALNALALATGSGSLPAIVLGSVDSRRVPLSLFVVDQCDADASQVMFAASVLLEVAWEGAIAGLVVASSRPAGSAVPLAEDLAAWPELDRRCREAGVELIDWFVLSHGRASSVPDHLDGGSRW